MESSSTYSKPVQAGNRVLMAGKPLKERENRQDLTRNPAHRRLAEA